MSSTTRSGGDATGLPGAMMRPEALSRRNALGAAAAVALSLAAIVGAPSTVTAAPVAISSMVSPDADLIALANRIAALAIRCRAVADCRATIEDRVFRLCQQPDPLPKPEQASGHSITETTTATATIYTIERPHERDPALVRWEEASAAAQAAHDERTRAEEARLGLPAVERRYDRMARCCDRWAAQLATMQPATTAGLTAKAAAIQALVGDNRFSREIEVGHYADLVMSLVADALRLGSGATA